MGAAQAPRALVFPAVANEGAGSFIEADSRSVNILSKQWGQGGGCVCFPRPVELEQQIQYIMRLSKSVNVAPQPFTCCSAYLVTAISYPRNRSAISV
jgi:hypothetical protein